MLTADEFIEPIRQYIVRHLLDGQMDLDRRTPLLEWGVIDSFALTDLLAFVEDEFNIAVPGNEITPENLRDLEAIGALLSRLDAAAERDWPSVRGP
jgi:acyl carrier protein